MQRAGTDESNPPARPGRAAGPPGALGIEVQPDDDYFDVMASVAATHWWYKARRSWLSQELRGRIMPDGDRLAVALDIGTGTAESLAVLEGLGAGVAAGTDLSLHALHHASLRTPRPKILSSLAERLPFAGSVADCLISMDVIEHLDDDVLALREYRRALRAGGVLFVTVPAYQFLWSEHDERAAHRRRYSAATLRASVEAAGFDVERLSYFYSFLVPPAVLLRRTPLRRLSSADTDEEASSMHPAVDAVFLALAGIERWVARRLRIRIPFGLSILCVASNPA